MSTGSFPVGDMRDGRVFPAWASFSGSSGFPFPVGNRDERKFTGLSVLDFQDFLFSKREMGGKFQRFFFWLFSLSLSVRVRDGRNSSCRACFLLFRVPFSGGEMD
jgi:hypothetical protein